MAVAKWLLLQHLVLVKLVVCCRSKETVTAALWERVQLYPHSTIFSVRVHSTQLTLSFTCAGIPLSLLKKNLLVLLIITRLF